MEDIKERLQQLIEEVDADKKNPYEALFEVKDLQKELKKTVDIIEGIAFEKCQYEDKTFKNSGYQIEKRSGRKVWDFKRVKSWIEADNTRKEVEDKLKAAYSANEKGLNMADENGEVVPLPQVTFTKDSLIIKKI